MTRMLVAVAALWLGAGMAWAQPAPQQRMCNAFCRLPDGAGCRGCEISCPSGTCAQCSLPFIRTNPQTRQNECVRPPSCTCRPA